MKWRFTARLVAYACSFLLVFIAYRYFYEVSNRNALLPPAKDAIEAISLGSSHNLALDFGALRLNGYHYWQAGGDLIEAEAALYDLSRQLPKLRIVFVPIPYILHDNASANPEVRFDFYQRDPHGFWLAGDWRLWFRAKSHVDFRFLEDLLFFDRSQRCRRGPTGLCLGPKNFQVVAADSLQAMARDNAEIRVDWIGKTLGHEGRDKGRVFAALGNMMSFARAKGYRLILYTSPCYEAFDRLFPAQIRTRTMTRVAQLAGDHNVEYYRYALVADLSGDHRLFMDNDHLNRAHGAPHFSKILLRDIERFKALR